MIFSLVSSDLATDNSISREVESQLLQLTVFHLCPARRPFPGIPASERNTEESKLGMDKSKP